MSNLVAAFVALRGSPGSRKTNKLRRFCGWNISFSDPHLDVMSESASCIESTEVGTQVFPKIHLGLNRKSSICERVFP